MNSSASAPVPANSPANALTKMSANGMSGGRRRRSTRRRSTRRRSTRRVRYSRRR